MKKVLWKELLPDEFMARLKEKPLVYMPLGICEPHGHIAAFGLDTIKAEYLCNEAATRFGGVVAPTQEYHIHETGYHAPWLEDVVGEETPYMTSVPQHAFFHFFIYQLRSFANAGFQSVLVISGHSGGNQYDLQRVADVFMQHVNIAIKVVSDTDLVAPKYEGDHAGKYEISQLMYLRPDLVEMSKFDRQHDSGSGGRLALDPSATEAETAYGKEVLEYALQTIGRQVGILEFNANHEVPLLTYDLMERIWQEVQALDYEWKTLALFPGQLHASENSRWSTLEKNQWMHR